MTSTKIHNKNQFDPDSYLSSALDLDLLNSVNLYLCSTFISQPFSWLYLDLNNTVPSLPLIALFQKFPDVNEDYCGDHLIIYKNI